MIKPRLLITIISITMFIFAAVTSVVLLEEYYKRKASTLAFNSSISKSSSDYSAYIKSYSEYVSKTVDENSAAMKKAEETYTLLLSQQPAIIAQHSRQVIADGSTTANSGSSSTGSSTTTSSGGSTKPAKPKSSSTSKAS